MSFKQFLAEDPLVSLAAEMWLRTHFKELTKEECREIAEWIITGDDEHLSFNGPYDKIYNVFVNNGEIPYGIAKGDTGDPNQWVFDHLHQLMRADGIDV